METINAIICYLGLSFFIVIVAQFFFQKKESRGCFVFIAVAAIILGLIILHELGNGAVGEVSFVAKIITLTGGVSIEYLISRKSNLLLNNSINIACWINVLIGLFAIYFSVDVYFNISQSSPDIGSEFSGVFAYFHDTITQLILVLLILVLGCFILSITLMAGLRTSRKFVSYSVNQLVLFNLTMFITISILGYCLLLNFLYSSEILFYSIAGIAILGGCINSIHGKSFVAIFLLCLLSGVILIMEGLLFDDSSLFFGGNLTAIFNGILVGLYQHRVFDQRGLERT